MDSGAISILSCRFVDNLTCHNVNFYFFHEAFIFEEEIVCVRGGDVSQLILSKGLVAHFLCARNVRKSQCKSW